MMRYPKLSPSALFLLTFITAISVSWVHSWQFGPFMGDEMMRYIGVFFLIVSFILNTLAYREFKKSVTPHAPFSTPKVLIQKGIFTFSRNPVYLALVLSQVGLGFVFDSVWLLLSSLILLTGLHNVIIKDEEKILESTFKEHYVRYKNRTRCWL